ncbi:MULTISPECIES: hypothetical protein [Providencia]|nr:MULTISPECIES: hypothetical protein [Providencia]
MPYFCCRADGAVMLKSEKGWSVVCGLVALLLGTGAYKLATCVLMIG